MSKTFLYSDPHFSHHGVCKFTNFDGSKMRPWTNPDDMDAELIQRFNDTVSEKDKCYVLGDVAINRRGLDVLKQIKCKNLVLIKGNHDIFRLNEYTPYFKDIRSYHVLNGMILSHIPLHPNSLYRFGCNIHGHLHSNRVMKRTWYGKKVIDPNYFSVCVEQIGFKPIDFDEVCAKIESQGGTTGFKQHR